RFRRICLPFIFSYLECKSLAELERLWDDPAQFKTDCIRTLNFEGFQTVVNSEFEVIQREARSIIEDLCLCQD
ncbi:hypothetical protein C8J56DRAFT_1033154, partial [Mycena floridula]